jgi:Asp-tRNA(Asn)/Glu-tRNA(Gln) amidotransferase C subunit
VIGEEELPGLARLMALEIPEQRAKAVLANLQRIEQVAEAVNAVELGPEDEIGPEWRP